MTADTFEINASPEELATMTAQLDAAEAQMAGSDASAIPGDTSHAKASGFAQKPGREETEGGPSYAKATEGRRTVEANADAAAVPGQNQKQSDETEVKPKDSSSTPDATETDAVTGPKPEAATEPKGNGDSKARHKSAYAREMERRDRSWKALNEEKQKFATEQARLAREREQLEQARQLAAEPEYTAAQYDHAASVFEAEGKRELAAEARAEAAKLRANPPDARRQEARRQAQISAGQAKSWDQVMAEFPNVRKTGSPENGEALRIVNEDPLIWNMHPNAPLLIARMAVSRLQAARVPELEQGLAKAKARIEELEKLTSPAPGGGPTETATAKSFDDKSLPEQEAELRQLLHGS